MIAFDLKCGNGHVFEAWFGSSARYADQRAAGLIACPICDDGTIDKALMTPNVAAKGNRMTTAPAVPPPAPAAASPEAVKAAFRVLAAAQAKALEGSQWVGGRFADRARAMHLGDEPAVAIHGRTTVDEAKALVEEGVPIAPLPLPVVPPEACN